MSTSRRLACLLVLLPGFAAAQTAPVAPTDYGIGTTVTPAQVKAWDITIGPKGENLPAGSGTVAAGKDLYAEQCSACHGEAGEGGVGPRLVGGIGGLAGQHPVKDVGSYWPYATTLFDFIRRAMPFTAPQSLTDDQVYAVSAYILQMNGIIPETAVMDRNTLPAVMMPNHDGFISVENGKVPARAP